jgi:protease-4
MSNYGVWSPEERQVVQGWMDEVYAKFRSHVTAIRGSKLKKPLDELAGGRVFTGKQALELGLVDRIGTLQDAIAHAAGEAKITDYDVRVVPASKNFFEQIMEEAAGGDTDPRSVEVARRRLAGAVSGSLVELAMPHVRHLDARRVAMIRQALERLQFINENKVMLVMPEVLPPN